jgi:hypothetical protein
MEALYSSETPVNHTLHNYHPENLKINKYGVRWENDYE